MAFNCVERVVEYSTELPAEAASIIEPRPHATWPDRGLLEVDTLKLRYKPELDLVLKGISFTASPGEHLGIVGRTGAGKSSLLLALLRIAEPEPGSRIILDGQNLLTVGLHSLREAIAMIPQEAVLFQGSLRYNCDPFNRRSPEDVWATLEDAQLAPWLRSNLAAGRGPTGGDEAGDGGAEAVEEALGQGLSVDTLLSLEVKEGGQNLSVGQRQMVAIAR